MKQLAILPLFLILLISCTNEIKKDSAHEDIVESLEKVTNPEFTVITVEYAEGWGYQILQDGKLAIDQKNIPVIQGYKGFSSREKAEITGQFIVTKLKKGIFPPTLTQEELDSLKVL